jgi:hypothetical protein
LFSYVLNSGDHRITAARQFELTLGKARPRHHTNQRLDAMRFQLNEHCLAITPCDSLLPSFLLLVDADRVSMNLKERTLCLKHLLPVHDLPFFLHRPSSSQPAVI